MKLRFERGALADLEEILAYIAADNPGAAARLALASKTRRAESRRRRTWETQRVAPSFDDFPSATI
jgi:plasmid stabilization system protein ParE